MKKAVVIFLFFLSFHAHSQNLFNNILRSVDGKSFSMSELKKNKASIVVFLLADCPACENYALTLNQMSSKYKGNGIRVYGVFPGNYSKPDEIRNYRSTYKISFPLLLDKDKKLVKSVKAKVAPQAFLINADGKVLYNGRIDNWMYAVGKKRTVITLHELQDAVDAFLKGKEIAVKVSTPVGCLIE